MIVIVDSGIANLRSIANAFEILGEDVIISREKNDIENAEKIVLPGVGSFAEGMANLHKYGLVEVLREEVLNKKKPFLGICLGMHLLGSKGYEFGTTEGLNFIPAEVKRFDLADKTLRIPHMGWNEVNMKKECSLFKDLGKDKCFYFVHSFNFVPVIQDCVLATCDYGGEFVAAIKKDNIVGLQFHPEKSQRNGLNFLERFIEWDGRD